MKEADPVWFCREQKDLYKRPCYAEVSLAWIYTRGEGSYEFKEAMDYIKSINDTPASEIGTFVTASDYVRLNRDVFDEIDMVI